MTVFLQSAWNAARSAISTGIDWLKQGFQMFIGFFQSIGTAISTGIQNIQNILMSIVTWINEKIQRFGEADKRLVTTLVNGIKSVAMAPINAVKGIFSKIGSLFPHSDVKEGPFPTLTLSGQRTMTAFADDVSLAEDAPARMVEKSFGRVKATLEQEPSEKVSLDSAKSEEDEQDGSSGKGSGEKSVIIQRLLMQADLRRAKDLQLLPKLFKELEDCSEANGSDGGDAEPEPTPA